MSSLGMVPVDDGGSASGTRVIAHSRLSPLEVFRLQERLVQLTAALHHETAGKCLKGLLYVPHGRHFDQVNGLDDLNSVSPRVGRIVLNKGRFQVGSVSAVDAVENAVAFLFRLPDQPVLLRGRSPFFATAIQFSYLEMPSRQSRPPDQPVAIVLIHEQVEQDRKAYFKYALGLPGIKRSVE